ncbi:MAG TPA: glycosyltransferase family 2 protein [Pyrinomonadaceae bacterium]
MPVKVSIIIPAYTVASFIGETLDSVFAQSFTGYEVIVINDGSPDTEEFERVLQPYLNRVAYLKQENRGASVARNAGLRAAQGELIAFLDADDIWLPSYLEEQVRFIQQHRFDLVCADAVHFGGSVFDGRTYFEVLMPAADEKGEVTFPGLVSGTQSLITSAVVARRESLLAAGLFDETLRNAQDYDLWIRLALRGARLGYQRKVLARYRYREESLSGNAVNRVNRELRVLQKVLSNDELTSEQRQEVDLAIQRVTHELSLVRGKEQLDQREFDKARASFREADVLKPSFKLKLVRLMLLIWPDLLRRSTSLATRWRFRQRSAMVR